MTSFWASLFRVISMAFVGCRAGRPTRGRWQPAEGPLASRMARRLASSAQRHFSRSLLLFLLLLLLVVLAVSAVVGSHGRVSGLDGGRKRVGGPAGLALDGRSSAGCRARASRLVELRRAHALAELGVVDEVDEVVAVASRLLGALSRGDERRVVSVRFSDKLVVGALLEHAAAAEDNDLVGVAHGGQTVGDHEGGALLLEQQVIERLLHNALALVVQRRGGLVEDENGRVADDGAGNRHALLLAAGHGAATLAHEGFKALGQLGDEVVRVRGAGGRLDFLARGLGAVHGTVRDVLGDGGGEEDGLLADEANVVAEPGELQVAHVLAIHGD
mmetsp:Transcript_11563/g.29319  ORF Transcript_11563/g.29319 Transcript_11563/m.29319 type:complete len:331 (-) Transcript_11563:430-1422(-)